MDEPVDKTETTDTTETNGDTERNQDVEESIATNASTEGPDTTMMIGRGLQRTTEKKEEKRKVQGSRGESNGVPGAVAIPGSSTSILSATVSSLRHTPKEIMEKQSAARTSRATSPVPGATAIPGSFSTSPVPGAIAIPGSTSILSATISSLRHTPKEIMEKQSTARTSQSTSNIPRARNSSTPTPTNDASPPLSSEQVSNLLNRSFSDLEEHNQKPANMQDNAADVKSDGTVLVRKTTTAGAVGVVSSCSRNQSSISEERVMAYVSQNENQHQDGQAAGNNTTTASLSKERYMAYVDDNEGKGDNQNGSTKDRLMAYIEEGGQQDQSPRPSEPGAFRAGSGQMLSHTEHSSFRRLVGDSDVSNPNLVFDHPVQEGNHGSLNTPSTIQPNPAEGTPSTRDLAVANLVSNDDDLLDLEDLPVGLVDADEHSIAESMQRISEKKSDTERSLFGLILGGLAIVVGIVLAVVLTRDQESTPNITEAPTVSPAPSAAPSFPSFEHHLLSLLPTFTVQTIEENNLSPQGLAMDWLLNNPGIENLTDWRLRQRFALAVFHYATGGTTSWNTDGSGIAWLKEDVHECHWWSTPSLSDYIIHYDDFSIPGYNTTFQNPCEINTEDELNLWEDAGVFQNMWLRGTNLTGTVPPEIGMLTSLRSINLKQSTPQDIWISEVPDDWFLVGSIPSEIGHCTDLEVLDLGINNLNGTLPTQIGYLSNIFYLSLSYDSLSGTIPSQLGLLTGMTSLDLFLNMFTGELPSEIGLMTLTEELYLPHNSLSGTLPTEIGLLGALYHFQIINNVFTGPLPSEIGWCTDLGIFEAWDNQLSGTLPSQIGLLNNTQFFYMHNNNLWGTIPSEIGWMTSMRLFFAYNMGLSGTIPSEVGSAASLGFLHLDNNALTGTIPSAIGSAIYFRSIQLHNNALAGPFPDDAFASLEYLSTLQLENNTLTGTISEDLCLMGKGWTNRTSGLYFDCGSELCGCSWCECAWNRSRSLKRDLW